MPLWDLLSLAFPMECLPAQPSRSPSMRLGTRFMLLPDPFFLFPPLFLLFQSLQTPRLSSGSTPLKSTPACPNWRECAWELLVQAIVEIKLPRHWKVLDLLLWWEMEISMCFLFKIMKYFLNCCFSLAGAYLPGVLNHPGSIAGCPAFSCPLDLFASAPL